VTNKELARQITLRLSDEQITALQARGIFVDRVTGIVHKLGREKDDPSMTAIADRINGQLYLGSRPLSDSEVETLARKQYDAEHEFDALDRELGLTNPTDGEDLVGAARELLATRGIHKPNYEEMADALVEVAL